MYCTVLYCIVLYCIVQYFNDIVITCISISNQSILLFVYLSLHLLMCLCGFESLIINTVVLANTLTYTHTLTSIHTHTHHTHTHTHTHTYLHTRSLTHTLIYTLHTYTHTILKLLPIPLIHYI